MKKRKYNIGVLVLMNIFILGTYTLSGQTKNKISTKKEQQMEKYTAPTQTKVGHIHLKVSDLDKALAFYHDLLGFEITQRYGKEAVFLSAGGYHHHIGLNTWHSKNAPKVSPDGVGMYHVAFLYPTRKDLALIFKRLTDNQYPIVGTADHGVSEAIYLNDPDGNGVELYWDKPRDKWPFNKEGALDMYTKPLNLKDLLKEIEY